MPALYIRVPGSQSTPATRCLEIDPQHVQMDLGYSTAVVTHGNAWCGHFFATRRRGMDPSDARRVYVRAWVHPVPTPSRKDVWKDALPSRASQAISNVLPLFPQQPFPAMAARSPADNGGFVASIRRILTFRAAYLRHNHAFLVRRSSLQR